MSDMHTDLVVQISTSEPQLAGRAATGEKEQDRGLITELRRCLQPGVEIALVFEGFMAITSILWLSDLESDGGVRAGVRLLGVSALPGERSESTVRSNVRHSGACAHADAATIHQHV